jgi:hypothetical protein
MRPLARYLVWLLLALSGTSVAQPGAGRRLRLDYQAPPSCPPASVFEAEVWRRLSPEGVRATEQRSLGVTIAQDAMGYRGTLRVSESSDGASGRELGSADCGELVRALALVAAVVLNPAETAEPGPSTSAAPPASPEAAPSAAAVVTGPKVAPVPSPPSEPSPRSYPPQGRLAVVGAVAASLHTAVAGDLVWSPRIAVGAEYLSIRWPWGIGIRLSLTRAESGVQTIVGSADFVWTLGRLEICPILRPSAGLTVGACGLFEAGEVRGTSSTTSTARRWLAPGGLARVEGRAFGPLWVYGDLGVTRPLIRTEFYVDRQGGQSSERVYKVPEAVLTAGLGLLVRWP